MFATTDSVAFRPVRLFVDAPGRSEQLAVTPSLEQAAARAALLPSTGLLTRLATAVASRERRRGQPVTTVRVEVAQVVFEGDPMVAKQKQLRQFVYEVPERDR